MAQVYSRKSLAETIGAGHDTASAAKLFNRSIDFIEHEQQTREYQYYLDIYLDSIARRTRQTERTAERGLTLPIPIEPPEPTGDGTTRRTGGMQPFSVDGMQGRTYGPMIPFNRYDTLKMLPYTGDPMDDRPTGTPMLGRLPRKRESGEDILRLFDGVPDLVRDYMFDLIEERIPDPTGPELITLLRALPVGSRLNFNWLDGAPTIPLNTASWHGAWQSETAYVSGSIVTDNNNVFIYIVDIPATNTTRPGEDTADRVEHLDVGSPMDIIDVEKAGLVFTYWRRGGDSFELTLTADDIYALFVSMNAEQKRDMRTVINAAPNNGGSIAALLDGALGTSWRQTNTGPPGPRGLMGLQGIQGLRGLQGPPGDAASFTLGNLLTLLAGATIQQKVDIRTIINAAPNNGALIVALIDAVLGTAWKTAGAVGPQGPRGFQGIQGPRGLTGPAGGWSSVSVTLREPGTLPVPTGSADLWIVIRAIGGIWTFGNPLVDAGTGTYPARTSRAQSVLEIDFN